MPHPIQEIFVDLHGHARFRENKIVRFLLDRGSFNLNDLASMNFNEDDREQFAQLIGYSLGGFSELPYVTDETYQRVMKNIN